MRRWWRRQNIRLRLTLWYAATLLVILLVYAIGVLAFVWYSLSVDLNRRLEEDFELAEAMLEQEDGQVLWEREHRHELEEPDRQMWVEVWSPQGQLLFRSASARRSDLGMSEPVGSEGSSIRSLTLSGVGEVRLLEGRHPIEGMPAIIRVIRSEQPLHQALAKLALVEFLGLPVAVVVAGLGGYGLARRALSPVARMTEQARDITADRLHERLDVDNPHDELGRLAEVFNHAFARLQRSFEQLRRFTSDASHELRTPLTSIRSMGEVALRESRRPEDYRETISSILEEVDRLGRLVESLLTLSRADQQRLVLHREPVDIAELAREATDDLGVLAEEKSQRTSIEVAVPLLKVCGDRAILRHAVLNLVDNAIKYSPEGTEVQVAVRREFDQAVLEVTDQGPGIAPEHRDRLFDRFYRIDKSRSRALGGAGLGLSIARWAVEAHNGRIEVDSEVGKGSTFRITLPLTQGTNHDEA